MSQKTFSSRVTLSFSQSHIEHEYKRFNIKSIILGNKILSILYFAFQLAEIIPFGLYAKSKNEENKAVYNASLVIKVLLSILELCLIITAFVVKRNYKVHRGISITNYILYFILSMNIKISGQFYFQMNKDYFNCILFTEFIIISLWHFFRLIEFKESILINFVLLIFAMCITFLVPRVTSPIDEAVSYAIMIIGIIISSYMITKEAKTSFYFYYQLETKNKWYENILNNLNTGFIHFEKNKIAFINNTLIEKLKTIKKFESFFHVGQNDIVSEEQSKQILDFIFGNITIEDEQSKLNPSTSRINQNSNEMNGQLLNNNHDLSINIFNAIKNICSKEKYQDNFTYIGRGNILIERLDSIDNSENNDQDNPNNIYPQVHYELHARYEVVDNYQIIINDITRTKQFEEKSAEFKFKNLLLAKIAHEFKNPIICIMELTEQLLEIKNELKTLNNYDNTCNNALNEKINLIKAFGDYLLILIKDLDYFSTSELKKSTSLTFSNVSINDILLLIQEIANALIKKNKKEKTVTFITKISKSVSINQINTDDIKLKQILTNLVSNSIKFTNKGHIKLKLSMEEKNYLKFTVSDTGIGIKDSVKKYIFTPFAKYETNNNHLGTGLGLSIVFDLTNKLGKGIAFESEYNKGSHFWFNIPISQEIIDIESNKTLKQYDLQLSHPFQISHKKMPSIKNVIRTQKKLTLIIADDEDLPRKSTIRIIKEIAKKRNLLLNIIEAEDGIDTMSSIYNYIFHKNGKIDAIISDETMKFIEGIKCADILSSSYRSQEPIPFFLVTAYEGIPPRKSIQGIFTKPLRILDVETIINYILH